MLLLVQDLYRAYQVSKYEVYLWQAHAVAAFETTQTEIVNGAHPGPI